MTAEEQRFVIAHFCGWRENDLTWFSPSGGRWARVNGLRDIPDADILPDYCGSLDAMHEAEKYLNGEQWQNYIRRLERFAGIHVPQFINPSNLIDYRLTHATAAQKAETFVKAIGQWKEVERCE